MSQRFNQFIYIAFFLCIIGWLISIRQCSTNNDSYTSSQNYIASLRDTITYLKHGIAQKPAVEVTKDQFEAMVKDNAFLQQMLKEAKLKAGNVVQSTKIVTVTQVDTIRIALGSHPNLSPLGEGQMLIDSTTRVFSVDSLHYTIAGSINKNFLSIHLIRFPDSLYVITASKKHLFRKDEYLVSVKHSNPYIKTVGLTNLTVTEPRKWYDSGWVKFGVGLIAGGYLVTRF